MPIYEFICDQCVSKRDVIIDTRTKSGLELLCFQCGGVMRASKVHLFRVCAPHHSEADAHTHQNAVKSCGHTHACRCNTVSMNRSNPFQKQIDAAIGVKEHD